MSDILIRGMEMPKSCYYCPFMIGSWGYSPPHKARCVISGKDMPVDERGVQHDPVSCPLIEVPPHGPLIDAEAFLEDVTQSEIMRDGFKEVFAMWIGTQEIVIPEDKEAE